MTTSAPETTAPETTAPAPTTTDAPSGGGGGGGAATTAPAETTTVPTTAPPTTAPAPTTVPPTTAAPTPGECLVGNWVITQDEMNAFYDTLEATVGAPLDITVSGQTLLDLTADTYLYTADFDLVVSAVGTSGEGQSSGTVSGTYTADDGVIVTTLGSSNLSVIVTVGGQTLDESAFANGLLGSVPINDAPYDCSGPTPVIMFETADPGVRHPVTLTPA
ncbi:hypothetical protein [Ilumatobacter fluminis]|uniref:hypothetical protein n=1 Tax=Ilumatobacter fluminis TaxID=467091 RepID=UPI00105FF2CA|nr:hypothetical protein [Ilumatobacter fluminis]